MTETFFYALRAILPILLMMLAGFAARRLLGFDAAFYRQLNSLCFRTFLPISLFCSVYALDDLQAVNWLAIGFLLAGVAICTLVGILAARLLVPARQQQGVIVQASFRSNQAILGLPLAEALGGQAALGFASLACSVCVPIYNILAVLVLSFYGQTERPSATLLLRRMLLNPLVIGIAAALCCVLTRQLLPSVGGQPVFTLRQNLPSLFSALTSLGRVATPCMLFVLGAQLDFGSIRSILPQLGLGIFLRLVFSPVLIIGLAVLLQKPLQLTTAEMCTFVCVTGSPVAVSSAVMAQEMGSDGHLAGQLVVWTSVLSLFTIFALVYCLRQLGFL